MSKYFELVAVESIQPVLRAKPKKTCTVLHSGRRPCLRQTVHSTDLMESDVVALEQLHRNSLDVWFLGHHTLMGRDQTRLVFAWNSILRNADCEEECEENSKDSSE